jgi:hypothetical protein
MLFPLQAFPTPNCCPPIVNGNKPGTIVGGSGSGTSGSHQSAALNLAQTLKNTSPRLAGTTIYLNTPLNAYGKYNGTSCGSFAPLRNTF